MKQPVPIFERSRISYYSLTALFALTCDVIYDFFFFQCMKVELVSHLMCWILRLKISCLVLLRYVPAGNQKKMSHKSHI